MGKPISNFKFQISNLPKKPGIYQFLDKNRKVIYIGKAKNLHSRVAQYFGKSDERPQIPFLMAEAANLNYTVVNSELESLYLENTLIKQYHPKYNILLMDDKNYAFIKIDYSTQIPQIGYARKIENLKLKIENSPVSPKYFGPYTAAYKIRNTLNLVRKIFPYCAASKVSGRPCFYYYMHRCPGVCIGKITLDEYNQQLNKIVKFLQGDTGGVVKDIKKEMLAAAKAKKFETAARLRDQLRSLQLLEEKQNVILPKKVDWDIISLFTDAGYACVNLFKIRGGKLFDKESFVYEITSPSLSFEKERNSAVIPLLAKEGLEPAPELIRGEVMQNFLEQYYLETSSTPKEIFLQQAVNDAQNISKILKERFGKRIKISVPQKGKLKNLIKLGQTNAREYLKNWLNDKAGNLDKINQALEGLKKTLGLAQIPKRIECYDISNTQGTNPVGSMVVFVDGKPAKSQYRKFKIQGKQTPDDFAMMKEMLARRLARSQDGGKFENLNPKSDLSAEALAKEETNSKFQIPNSKPWPLPDLIVIDGGKGQLSAALKVLQKYPISNIQYPIIGLAKRIEEIFLPNKPEPIILSHDDPSLQLLQRLRDEAHRFGITFHRQLRSKQAVKSALDDIPGIGPKTKKLLKAKFGTIANIRKTKFDDLAAVVGKKIAQLIQQSL